MDGLTAGENDPPPDRLQGKQLILKTHCLEGKKFRPIRDRRQSKPVPNSGRQFNAYRKSRRRTLANPGRGTASSSVSSGSGWVCNSMSRGHAFKDRIFIRR